MKNTLIALFLLLSVTNTAQAQTEWDQHLNQNPHPFCEAYPYFTLGVGPFIVLPNVGVGYRGRFLQNGFDVSISGTTVIQGHQIQSIIGYQFYPNPFRVDPWYVGLGVASSLFFDNECHSAFTIAPDLSVGKVMDTKSGERHFLEAHIQAPTFARHDRIDLPLMYIKYGVSF